MDIVNSHLNFNSKHLDKCKFALKLIPIITVSNLFSVEVAQKCQHCQLCVLWENAVIAGLFRVSLFIELGGAEDLVKCSCCLMIIRLPVS